MNPREEEFDQYMEILRVLPSTVTNLKINLSCNDVSFKQLTSLLELVAEFDLKKLSLDFASTGLDQASFEYLLDWLECTIFVEESLHLDLSV